MSEGNFGVSNLQKKQEQIEIESALQVNSLDDLQEFSTIAAKFITEDVPKTAAKSYKIVKNFLTPGFIKRFKTKKIYAEKVENINRFPSSFFPLNM